jgi:hypothetical protein
MVPKTGDIVLLNNFVNWPNFFSGFSISSSLATFLQLFTGSEWSHVAMLINLDDLMTYINEDEFTDFFTTQFPTFFKTSGSSWTYEPKYQYLVWEWGMNTTTKEEYRSLVPLWETMDLELEWATIESQTKIAFRSLSHELTPHQYRILLRLIMNLYATRVVSDPIRFFVHFIYHGLLGTIDTPFESKTVKLLVSLILLFFYSIGAKLFGVMCFGYLISSLFSMLTEHTCKTGESFICSDLIATTYQAMEIFDCDVNTKEITPRDYSQRRLSVPPQYILTTFPITKSLFSKYRMKMETDRSFEYYPIEYSFGEEDVSSVQDVLKALRPLI